MIIIASKEMNQEFFKALGLFQFGYFLWIRKTDIIVNAYAHAHPNDIRLKKSFINVVAFISSIKIRLIASRKQLGMIG